MAHACSNGGRIVGQAPMVFGLSLVRFSHKVFTAAKLILRQAQICNALNLKNCALSLYNHSRDQIQSLHQLKPTIKLKRARQRHLDSRGEGLTLHGFLLVSIQAIRSRSNSYAQTQKARASEEGTA